MLEAMKKDVEGRFSDYVTKGQLKLHVAYTTDEETAKQWKEEVQNMFPDIASHEWIHYPSASPVIPVRVYWQLRHHMHWMLLNNCRILL